MGSAEIITANLRVIERLSYQFKDVFSRQSEITSSSKNL